MLKHKVKKALLQINFLMLTPLTMFANNKGVTPVSKGLEYLTDAITGTTGITIATLALMSVGLGCLFHKIEWKVFGYTVATIGIIFGAKSIVVALVDLIGK